MGAIKSTELRWRDGEKGSSKAEKMFKIEWYQIDN